MILISRVPPHIRGKTVLSTSSSIIGTGSILAHLFSICNTQPGTRLHLFLTTVEGSLLSPPATIGVERAITDRLINDDVTITDFNIVQARWIGANPCFVLNGSSLATEIRKRNQITFTTLATPGKCIFHEIASFLHIGGNMHLLTHKSR
jgi:hypothetical protein